MNTALHHALRSPGLGAACSTAGSTAALSIQTGMRAAAAADPEPMSKAVLAVGSFIMNFFSQPDCDKLATTAIVTQAERLLQQNLAAWQSLPPAQKNFATQSAALANFDATWAAVVQACTGTAVYGSAGQACVADRQAGACHYQPNGQCWNWFVGYRDPIANDPQVSLASPLSLIGSILPGTGGIDPNLLIGGALLVGALLLANS